MDEKQKTLTPSQKADKLWSVVKTRAAGLRHGRISVDLVVREGHVVQIEIIGQRESLIGE